MKTIGATLLLLLAGACGSVPEMHYYVLGAPGAASTTTPAAGGVRLGVEVLRVDPPYDQDQLVYRIGDGSAEVGFYTYHRWAAPPGRLLQVALAENLRGLPGTASVEPARDAGDYGAHLTGRVLVLEEVDLPGSQVARLRLQLALVDAGGDVVWSQEATAEVRGQAASVADVARQMQRAVAQAADEIRPGLAAAMQGLLP